MYMSFTIQELTMNFQLTKTLSQFACLTPTFSRPLQPLVRRPFHAHSRTNSCKCAARCSRACQHRGKYFLHVIGPVLFVLSWQDIYVFCVQEDVHPYLPTVVNDQFLDLVCLFKYI